MAEEAHPDANSPGERQRGWITLRLNAAKRRISLPFADAWSPHLIGPSLGASTEP